MPKIKDLKVTVAEREKVFTVYFSESEGFYVKGGIDAEMLQTARTHLPEGFTSIPNKANTISALTEQLKDVLRAYYKAIETKRRVIMVKILFSNRIMYCPDSAIYRENYSDKFKPAWMDAKLNGMGLSIKWFVAEIIVGIRSRYFEMERNESGELVAKNGGGSNFDPKKEEEFIILDYSEEGERFFESIDQSMQQMSDKIAAFFSKDKDALQSAIQSMPSLMPNTH